MIINKKDIKDLIPLVVDDEAFCLDAISIILNNLGITTIIKANNGLEAIDIIKIQAKSCKYFDFIVMD